MEGKVTILNLTVPESSGSAIRFVKGDACDLSTFEDRSFDIVFSNSVIEHVGGIVRQEAMAKEARRVGRKYWIQTPNKHFPIEVHFLFPFFQYLPGRARRFVAETWPFSFARAFSLDPIFEAEHIWWLTKNQMSHLFPDATIHRERVLGLTKSLVAFRA